MSQAISHRPMFVVFEGLDGSGKSTCARAVASALGAELLTTPSPRVREFRDDVIESFEGCQEAAQLFYLSTVFAASREVATLLAAGRSVVLDRYFLSTQCYAESRGSRLRLDALADSLVRPTLTVFLHAATETRRARLLARGASGADRETLDPAMAERLHAAHVAKARLSVVGRFVSLDTGTMPPAEVVSEVLGILGVRRFDGSPLLSG